MGKEVRVKGRVGTGVRVRIKIWVRIRRSGVKKKKSEENTTKGQNVFIQFQIEKTKKN